MSEVNIDNSPFTDLANAVKDNQKPQLLSVKRGDEKSVEVLAMPDGMTAHSLKKFVDENRLVPERRSGCIHVSRLQSLIDITNRFKNSGSAIFADASIDENSIEAKIKTYFDYHPESAEITDAQNLGHTAVYQFPVSHVFQTWLDNNKSSMNQGDFALFLEEHSGEIASPSELDKYEVANLKPKFADSAEIVALSRDLELYSESTLKDKRKLSSGEVELTFVQEHKDAGGNKIQIPDFFVLRVPMFEGGEPERILVRLRYRLSGSAVVWHYDLYRVDQSLDRAFSTACEKVKTSTELPLFFGSAEK